MNPQQTPLVVWVLAQRLARLRRDQSAPAAAARADAGRGAARRRLPGAHAGSGGLLLRDGVRRLVPGSRAARDLLLPDPDSGVKTNDYQAGWREGGGMATAALARRQHARRRARPPRRRVPGRGREGLQPPAGAQARRISTTGRRTSSTTTCALLAATELDGVRRRSARRRDLGARRAARRGAGRGAAKDDRWRTSGCADADGERS